MKLLFYILCLSISVSAQKSEKIRFKKQSAIYFFKLGGSNETLRTGDLFFFSIPDSLKSRISIEVDNGYLQKKESDTTLVFQYVGGLKYECLFVEDLKDASKPKEYELKYLINGVTDLSPSVVKIVLNNKLEGKEILSNRFYFRGR